MVVVKFAVIFLQLLLLPIIDVHLDQSVAASAIIQRLIVRLEEPTLPSSDNCTFFKQIENVLTSTSEQLHNVTGGRLQWDRISVLVSKSLAQDCFRLTRHQQRLQVIKNKRMNAQLAASQTADIVIHDGSHPLIADLPHAKQYGGCNQQGLGVHLSRSFIRSYHPLHSFISGRQVLREWVKHRYGVFDETGFDADLQYPLHTSEYGSHPPNSTELQQENSCTTFANNTSDAGQDDRRNGHFDTAWNSTSQEVKATPPQTSIMASLDAEDWCDGSSHIRWMPTKQNVLCQEQSIWQVMETHPDFKRPSPSTTTEFVPMTDDPAEPSDDGWMAFFPPEFEYILPSNGHRYILVLDRTPSSRRWSLIRRALYRWIHALPSTEDRETHLSVIVSSASDHLVVLGWTKVTAENRDGLVGRIPRRPLGSSPPMSSEHLVSAIRLAHQMLNDEKEATCCGGQLIVLAGTSIEMQLDEQHDVTVHAIAFPSRRTTLIDLGVVNGLQLAVDDDDEETSLTQSRLAAAFLQILRYDQLDTPTQVLEETVTSTNQMQSGTFTLDAPLGANVRVVAHCADEADLDTVEVVSPNGRVYDLPLVSDGMLHIRIPHTDEFGEWNYRLRFAQPVASSSRQQVATTVEVTAQPAMTTTQIYDQAITVQAWTNVGRVPVNASQTPILIYAEVRRGRSPIVDAKVTALVYPPEGSDNSTVQGPFLVQLYDKGTGDPDITRADGIYSAYFTNAINQPGHYAVTIQVTDNNRKASIPVRKLNPPAAAASTDACCGSSMPYEQTVLVQPFRRIISGPSFVTVDGPSEDEDVYPPGRISDLRVERIVNATNEVELGWTAPGTDYDSGSAAFYQIRCYTDRSALNDSGSAILVHASLTPQPLPAGTWQKAMVAVPWPNQIFYYAIVAVDFAGLRGKVSNIVPVYIEEPPPPPTTTTINPVPLLPAGELDGNNVTRPEAASQALSEQQMYAIAGGVAGFILLLVILSIAACLSRRKRSDDRQEKPNKSSSSTLKIQVEPLKISPSHHHPAEANAQHQKEQEATAAATTKSSNESRPVYKIYVNNAYIQEEDGELKIVTPDGRIIQRGSPWFSSANTLPRGRSLTNLEGLEAGTSATDLNHWSLPRAKTSPHRHKVLTNGSIMPNSGSQSVININNPSSSSGAGGGAIADGTSISSKPSVSSDDTGIEVSDHQTDSRDSAEMILPPPGFGPIQNHNGYMPMYANHNMLPPLPPSPGMSSQHQQDSRLMRMPSFLDNNNPADHHDVSGGSLAWLGDFPDSNFCSQPSSRRPLMIGSSYGTGSEDRTPQISPPPPSTPTSQSSVVHQPRRKTRHISFV
ncbi:calcium-activated chloride channel regulator 1-like [Daphnia carinata]|uniref:calcium-activated chloride channel regulator 1-like n=1 Tax=Daphnia carinata TaxID=120202 RepID=UPI00257E5FB2|nr:calcium-activated chloride channel regulator 1-like [Daphnia carinata]